MRSITFISAVVLAVPAVAQTEADLIGTCYTRSYDGTHLAHHPGQTVAALRVRFQGIDGFPDAHMSAEVFAQMADTEATQAEGTVGQTIDQWTFCKAMDKPWIGGPEAAWIKAGRMTCYAECDGGMFQITRFSDDSLTIKTNGLVLGEDDGCGGFSMLADVDGAGNYVTTAYRLFKAAPADCEGG